MDKSILSNKQQKIALRKQCKYRNILFKDTGIEYSATPTNNIMICNAGLMNGVGEPIIVDFFSIYGPLESVVLLKSKTYSFVKFSVINDAMAAFTTVNGIKELPGMTSPLRLIYCKSVPEKENASLNILPDGLQVIENFVTEDEEDILLKCITWDIPSCENTGRFKLKHRRVKHYGYEFNYDNNNVDKTLPLLESIPNECSGLLGRLNSQGFDSSPWVPDQLTVNEYQPGQGIPSHVDTHSAFESPILSLSLGSDAVMEFKHRVKGQVNVPLPRRSLLVMNGESRYEWTHGITPRKIDVIQSSNEGVITRKRGVRTSFTFRRIRHSLCRCNYPDSCDSQKEVTVQATISNNSASRLEEMHVHKVYDEISTHFSETRFKPWQNVAGFVNSLPIGSFLVDVGCGNGKYFGSNKVIFEVGCDRSPKLSEECYSRGFQVFTCNCLQLPIRSDCADGVISIAVIHHLSTYERRIDAIKEMIRILRVGGKGLVYVWAKDQLKDKTMSTYLKQDRKNRKMYSESSDDLPDVVDSESDKVDNEFLLPVHQNRTQFKHEDLLVPWKLKTNKDKVFYRFYHVFKDGELEDMFSSLDCVEIINSFYDQGNWCVLFEKIK